MSEISLAELPSFNDVGAAAARLAGWALRTPLLESPTLNARLGLRLLLKAEPLQRTGSFKFRGAFNRLSMLGPAERAAGIVAFSSGNHAQGVAHAATLLGIRSLIVMPQDAPAIKLANTRGYGAEVVTYDRWREDREAVAARIAGERGSVTVKPYDDAAVIAGQGTVALEAVEQAKALGAELDTFVVPAGGGGLTAGCVLAVTTMSPGTRIYTAEPVGFDDHARSLAAGERVTNDPAARTICDALMAPTPGRMTFAINAPRLAGGVVASDDEVRHAMAIAFQEFKLVLEPGGAVALAAVLAGRLPDAKTVGVVASGGNVDPAAFAQSLRS
ncbi:MAG TPA: threonine/serine dehydratase [Stellaceae bacterium]|nr:threonine/serine dehydratase [Stellaceae bacterium]